jgi:hypothetical protein
MSKDKVVGALNQKSQALENECKVTEKKFLKEEMDVRAFMREYVKQRREYHKYQILKVKVQ